MVGFTLLRLSPWDWAASVGQAVQTCLGASVLNSGPRDLDDFATIRRMQAAGFQVIDDEKQCIGNGETRIALRTTNAHFRRRIGYSQRCPAPAVAALRNHALGFRCNGRPFQPSSGGMNLLRAGRAPTR